MTKQQNIRIFAIILFAAIFSSCHTIQKSVNKNKLHGDTIELINGIPLYDPSNRFIVLFDSVVVDSRCPKNVQCIWKGNATVKINFNNLQKEIESNFTMDTHVSFNNDTTINNYYFKLLDLNPYPGNEKEVTQKEQAIRIIVKEM